MDHDKLQELENLATEKLIDYINNDGRASKLFQENYEEYEFLDMERSHIPFNLWLCCDYRDQSGRGFVHRLIEADRNIPPIQREILLGKAESFVTILEIKDFYEPYAVAFDVLNHTEYRLLEPRVSVILKKGDYLLARVGKVLSSVRMLGEVNFIPRSALPYLLREVIRRYNDTDVTRGDMKSFLKTNSLFLYESYYHTAYENHEPDEGDMLPIYDEMDEFEEYLSLKSSQEGIERHLSNLIELYEYELADNGASLKDLNKVNLKEMLQDMISEKFITTPLMLSSYFSTLREYLGFLAKNDKTYRRSLAELQSLSQERFRYVKEILRQNRLSQGDPLLSIRLREIDYKPTNTYLDDFDRFLLYVYETPVGLAENRRTIKRKDLNGLSRFLEGEYPMLSSRRGSTGVTILDFFSKMGVDLKLLRVKEGQLVVTSRTDEYLGLSREDKLTMHLKCFWKSGFIRGVLGVSLADARRIKKAYLQITRPTTSSMYELLELSEAEEDHAAHFVRLLNYMGIVDQRGWGENFVQTPIGRLARAHFLEWDRPTRDKVIHLKQYKTNK